MRNGHQAAGLDCPNCGTFIPMSLEQLVRNEPFICVNPSCGTELRLIPDQSGKSMEILRNLKDSLDKREEIRDSWKNG